MRRLSAFSMLLLSSCATPPPITNQPITAVEQAVAATPVGKTVVQGLQDAEWNLDQAIAIGVLPASDPADGCLHQALTQMGQEPGAPPTPAAQQFTPRISDLISGGSVLYILSQQALAAKAQLGAGISVPVACEALVGQFVIQAGSVGMSAVPSMMISGKRR